ncbi:hypothetical protein vseg_012582 [Gypsophila vaccaria]
MTDNTKNEAYDEQVAAATTVETSDRGLFDFVKKEGDKEELKPTSEVVQEEKFASDFDDKVRVSDEVVVDEEEAKHGSLLEKFHQADADSSSASSSDEEDDEEKKKKKREKKERKGLKEKLFGQKDEEYTSAPIEKPQVQEVVIEKPQVQEVVHSEPSNPEDVEKKGFLDKIKDKLPGHKKADDQPEVVAETVVVQEVEVEEKKGLMDRIKDKIPGFGSKVDEDKKDHE